MPMPPEHMIVAGRAVARTNTTQRSAHLHTQVRHNEPKAEHAHKARLYFIELQIYQLVHELGSSTDA